VYGDNLALEGGFAEYASSPNPRWPTSRTSSRSGPAHFEPVADLCVTGEVNIHIDRTFTLDERPAALAHVGEGRALGKVVAYPS
jgi:NADPH:quinone reductase-like Zn-dependent oxidoreductase